MTKILMVLVILSIFCLFQTSPSQSIANFENEPANPDTIEGFFDAKWFGPFASFERIADPTGRSAGILKLGCDGSLADRGVVQSWGRDPKGATVVSWHIYLPTNFPDSAIVSVWGDDNVTGWSWNSTDYYGIDLPKETWYPVYFFMERRHIEVPDGFNPFDGNWLAHFGIQIFYQDLSWSGDVYVDDPTFYETTTLADFEMVPANPDTIEGFFDAKWFGPFSAFERAVDPTERSEGILLLGCDGSLADRGVVQSWGRDHMGATVASWHVYLPSTFPDSAIISVWGDDDKTGWSWNSTDIYGIDVPKDAWYPVYFLMEQRHIEVPDGFNPFDGNILAHFGIQIFYQDLSWSDTVYIDDASFLHGEFVTTAIKNGHEIEIPRSARLYSNYPNPFNPTTSIVFDMPTLSHVSLIVYNMLGQEVKTLVEGPKGAGHHLTVWDGTNNFGEKVTSGLYFYVLITGDTYEVQKMVLMK
jgi:hypothetical protein